MRRPAPIAGGVTGPRRSAMSFRTRNWRPWALESISRAFPAEVLSWPTRASATGTTNGSSWSCR